MTARATRYRVVSYAPNPLGIDRITVGAVVEEEGGRVQVLSAPVIPGVECAGGPINHAHLSLIRKLLYKIEDFDVWPQVFGPQVFISDPVEIFTEHPERLVNLIVFRREDTEPNNVSSQPRSSKRSAHGRRYFDSKGIKKDVVRANYRPPQRKLLWPITHYVQSSESLLLLEPLSPLREQRIEDDLRDVFSRFHAYRDVLGGDSHATMIAYLLPGFPSKRIKDARNELAEVAKIVDLGKRTEEQEFLSGIRRAVGLVDEIL